MIFFVIRPKPDHTHVGALREEGMAPKISRKIFSRLAEIRENKCPRTPPRLYGIQNINMDMYITSAHGH